jgi:signal transduction histidine kinase
MMGHLAASIAHEVNQPIAAVVTNAHAAVRWLGAQPPDPDQVRQALGDIIKDGNRANDVIGRIRALQRGVSKFADWRWARQLSARSHFGPARAVLCFRGMIRRWSILNRFYLRRMLDLTEGASAAPARMYPLPSRA